MTAFNSSFRDSDTSVLGRHLHPCEHLHTKTHNYKIKTKILKQDPTICFNTVKYNFSKDRSKFYLYGCYSLDPGPVCLSEVSCAKGLILVWGYRVLKGGGLVGGISSFRVTLFREITNVFTRVRVSRTLASEWSNFMPGEVMPHSCLHPAGVLLSALQSWPSETVWLRPLPSENC